MRLLCLGDVAISGLMPAGLEWDAPDGFEPGQDDRILFNYELPAGLEVNATPRTSGERLVGSPDAYTVLRRWAPGFATLANNHILDAGETGLFQTRRLLKSIGIEPIGAAFSESETGRPFTWETEEGCAAIFNWVFPETHPEWMCIPGPVCWPGTARAGEMVAEAKKKADWVLAVLHWSDELFSYPREEDRKTARFLAAKGVDMVIGQHPHVVRGMEIIEGCPIFYSLGNFYFPDLRSPQGEWISKEAPRNKEGLGVVIELTRGKKARWAVRSFWRVDDRTVPDRLRRAERRLRAASRPLSEDGDYGAWYARKRVWFDRVGYRLHFRLGQMSAGEFAAAGSRVLRRLKTAGRSG